MRKWYEIVLCIICILQHLKHTFALSRETVDSGTSYNVANGSTFKFANCDANAKVDIGNEEFALEAGCKPSSQNREDQALAFKLSSKFTPASGIWDGCLGFKYGSPLVGPLRFWTTVSIPIRLIASLFSLCIVSKW